MTHSVLGVTLRSEPETELPVPQVFVDGVLLGELDRNERPTTVQLQHTFAAGSTDPVLDVLVSAMGRLNFGCGWDVKGLTSPLVTLGGTLQILEGM